MPLTLPLVLLLSAAPAAGTAPSVAQTAPADERFPTDLEPRDADVPPGDAADRSLWTDLRTEIGLGIGNLARISVASYRIQWGRYYEALDARAKAGDEEAKALRAALEAAGSLALEATPRKAIVHPCRVTLLELEHRMPHLDDPRAAEGMPKVRAEATSCVQRLRQTTAAVIPAAEALEAELARVDRHLKRDPPAPDAAAAAAAREASTR